MIDFDRYQQLAPEHDPARMPHERTVHRCEAVIYWYDTYVVEEAPRPRTSAAERITTRLPHCHNERCDCTQRAAEVLVATIDTAARGACQSRIVATHVNVLLDQHAPCQRRKT